MFLKAISTLGESIILFEFSALKLNWFLAGALLLWCIWFGACAFETTFWLLAQYSLDFIVSVVAQLVCQVTLSSFPVYILVNRSSTPVSEKGFVIQIVLFIIPKAMTKPGCLIKQSLIIHHIFDCWLGLAESDLLWDVTILVPLTLSFVKTRLLSSSIPFILFSEHPSDLISFPFSLF